MGKPRTSIIFILVAIAGLAIAAPSYAASAINTTAFTCVESAENANFSDAHCDNKVAVGAKFAHVAIPVNQATEIAITNAATAASTTKSSDALFKGKFEIKCTAVSGTGTLTNVEPKPEQHQITGELTTKYAGCTVEKPVGCGVKQPIEMKASINGVEGLGVAKNEMGVEFTPKVPAVSFGNLKIEGCGEAGVYPIKGSAISTGTPPPAEKWAGATWKFELGAMTETLMIGGEKAELESATTIRMAPVGGVTQNPIALTTVTGS